MWSFRDVGSCKRPTSHSLHWLGVSETAWWAILLLFVIDGGVYLHGKKMSRPLLEERTRGSSKFLISSGAIFVVIFIKHLRSQVA